MTLVDIKMQQEDIGHQMERLHYQEGSHGTLEAHSSDHDLANTCHGGRLKEEERPAQYELAPDQPTSKHE